MLIERHELYVTLLNGTATKATAAICLTDSKEAGMQNENGAFFSQNEKSRYDSMRAEKLKRNFALGRTAVKHAVMKYYEADALSPELIEICNTLTGKPYVCIDRKPCGISVSLSHSGETAVAIAGDAALCFGIDMECGAVQSREKLAEWVAREAVGKYLGIGLTAKKGVYLTDVFSDDRRMMIRRCCVFSGISVGIVFADCCVIALAHDRRIKEACIRKLLLSAKAYMDARKQEQ